jgi:RimJ/RimL family protein N-acetyltransferase
LAGARGPGKTWEGTLRESEFIKGAYRDIKLYSILRREYRGA